MPNRTDIEWVLGPDGDRGYTWNPLTGCLHKCPYCYARRFATRMRGRYGYPYDEPFRPTFHADRLRDLERIPKPSGIFVCSMADLFGAWVPLDQINEILAACRKHPQHTYYFLTKNIQRIPELQDNGMLAFPHRSFVGVTIDNPRMKVVDLDGIVAGVRFISFEPLLGPPNPELKLTGVDWAIVGAMTGQHAVAPQTGWVVRLVKLLHDQDVPMFIKDNLVWPGTTRPREHPVHRMPKEWRF